MSALELIEPEAPTSAAAPPQRELSVIEHAARSGATPEQLLAIIELTVRMDNHKLEMMREKRRMDEEDRASAALLAFRRDFAAFRGENIVVMRGKHVDRGRAGSFNQAEYYSVAEKLSPALSKHGFGFRHNQTFGARDWPTTENPGAKIGWVTVTCYLEHKDGHGETMTLEGPEGDQSANTAVQNMQLTASYLKRQSLLAITGTATGGEDDENAMRRRGNAEGADVHGDEAAEAELQNGRDAAMDGMVSLNAWWGGLTAKQRTKWITAYKDMRVAAAAADKAVAQ